jgi:hypothetical protein
VLCRSSLYSIRPLFFSLFKYLYFVFFFFAMRI